MKKLNQQGVTLVELLIASAILATMASAVMMARSYMAKQTVRSTDKAYATQKAIQMFEELKALVNGSESGTNVLDQYSDGSKFNTILTTDKTVDTGLVTANPGDPLSGNKSSNGNWRFLRQVQINNVPNNPYARQVIINVWRYSSDQNPGQPGDKLAEVGGVLTTISTFQNPTQVYDVYLLSINNIQGWWSQIPELFATFQGVVGDIQGRNPGLEIRPHYITRSSYGRNPQYIPYINKAKTTDQQGSVPFVYFYPGATNTDNNAPDTGAPGLFYDPGSLTTPGSSGVQLDGTVNVDGSILNPTFSSGAANCPSYPVADQYNHSMRYPDELAMYNAVSQAAVAAAAAGNPLPLSSPITEISERMLIEGMLSAPQSFTNALIINLHGEMLPLPPMRNYSDAAKDPVLPGQPQGTSGSGGNNIRLITHPENLFYPFVGAGTTVVNLRVYGYYDGMLDMTHLDGIYPDTVPGPAPPTLPGQMPVIPVANILLPGLYTSNPNNIAVTAVVGDAFTSYQQVPLTLLHSASNGMSFAVSVYNVAPVTYTQIFLYNTPLRCPPAPDFSGLDPNDRLYGLEYIPCSPERLTHGPPFTTQDLTDTTPGFSHGGTSHPKNTARWILSIPMTVSQQEIDTAIGPVAPVTLPAQASAPNQSRTYVWVGGDGAAPPWTERYQFLGDPRHCPYLDVKVGGIVVGGMGTVIEANGYNWYFKPLTNTGVDAYTAGYAGFGAAQASGPVTGWNGIEWEGTNQSNIDVPRFYEMIRKGLLNTTAIWTTMNGWSYYYYGFGGEMGSDQAPFSNGLTIVASPWNTSNQGAAVSTVAEMLQTSSNINRSRVIAEKHNSWYAKTWLGELFPDDPEGHSMYPDWSQVGNLPSLDNPDLSGYPAYFYRSLLSVPTTLAWPAYAANSLNGFGRDNTSQGGQVGSTSFFNGQFAGGGGGVFAHQGTSWVSTLLPLGADLYNIFQYPLALNVNLTRPWSPSATGQPVPEEWNIAPYSSHTSLSVPVPSGSTTQRLFYDTGGNSTWNGSTGWCGTGVVKMQQVNGGVSQTAYIVESGLSISADVGTAELGKTALVALLRTYLDGGLESGADHIVQLPLPKVYVNSVINQFVQPSSISVTVTSAVLSAGGTPITNVWFRYPGVTSSVANYYTAEYTAYGYPTLSSNTYSESVSLDLNLKYSADGGKTWLFMQDNSPAVVGVLNTTPTYLITGNAPLVYTWNVSNTNTFPQGDYFIRAEVYRAGYPLDYAYHVLDVSINR